MKTLTFIFILLFFSFFVSVSYADGLFKCEDTPYNSNYRPNVLESKYHLLQIYGDVSFQNTNFFKKNYDGAVGWAETRFVFPRFSEFINTPIPLPDPFFIGTIKDMKDIDWEDRFDYGIGMEWRPLKRANSLNDTFLEWTKHLRFYAVYLKTEFLKDEEELGWKPHNDFRAGVDLYRECNLYNNLWYWGEFWGDASWRKTNFYVDDFKSWTFSFVPKVGIKLFPDKALAPMPYATGEVSLTERREFWENRALAGAGLRFMPFRFFDDTTAIFIKGLKIYTEALWVVDYFKDDAPHGTPNHDYRVGLNFTINWW